MVPRFFQIFALASFVTQSQVANGFVAISGKAALAFETAIFLSDESSEGFQSSQSPSEREREAQETSTPSQPASTQPRPMDPLMASLTRIDPSTANKPTRKIPIFGEVPVDGSLTVLAPAAAIAVLGFILSIVVAFNSKDEFVQIITQASQELADQASQKTNMVYDESVCRGLCSSQDQDLEGLKTFMESLTK